MASTKKTAIAPSQPTENVICEVSTTLLSWGVNVMALVIENVNVKGQFKRYELEFQGS